MKQPSRPNPYQAYNSASYTAPKTRQVVMLYDGIIRNLQQAGDAMQRGDISTRFNTLKRASEIILGLQMSLDFDQGGDSAQTLYDFYGVAEARITQLHRSNDHQQCLTLIDEIKAMRQVWDQIDKGETMMEPAAAQAAAAPDATEDMPVIAAALPVTFSA